MNNPSRGPQEMLIYWMYSIPEINLKLRNNVFLIYKKITKDRDLGKENFKVS